MGFIRAYDWEGEEKPAATVFLTPRLRIRLTDPHKHPVANGKCRLADDPGTEYACDEHGIAEIPLPDRSAETVELEWESADMEGRDASERFPWNNRFEVDIRSAEDADCAKRLTHLGFLGDSLADQVTRYQEEYGLAGSGRLSDIRDQLVAWHDGGGPPGAIAAGASGGTSLSDAAPASAASRRKRTVIITEHDEHDWDETEAAADRHGKIRLEIVDDASRNEILEAMKAVKYGDIFVFEGHTYSTTLGGPVEGIMGDNWFGEDKVTLADIRKHLGSSPPSVAVFAGCNSNEIFPSAMAAGVKVVFGIENVIRNTISDAVNGGIADKITACLIKGLTLNDAMAKVNDWLDKTPLNNGNRLACDYDGSVDLDLNLDDNGI